MNRQPPSWIERLLRRFLDTRLLDAVLGDLYEKFQKRLAGKNSEWKASLLYCLEGIGFLRLARPAKRYPKASPLDLYRNYFTVALRYFQHEKAYSLLNFNGLFIGLTSAIILFIFVFNELSFDKFHKDYDRIYRLTTVFKLEEKETKYALNEGLWDDILIDEVVGVEHSTAFMPIQQELVMAVDNKSFLERKGFFSDPDFFKVFDFALLSGNRDNLLAEPNEMVVTRSFAERLFGTSDVLARPLTWRSLDGPIPLTVTGVVEDIPVNSSISFDFIISGSSMSWWKNQFSQSNRPGNTLHIYFKTAQHQEISDLQKTVDKAFSKKIKSTNAFSYETPVQPLANIYLNANNEFELIAGGNMNYIRIFFMIYY